MCHSRVGMGKHRGFTLLELMIGLVLLGLMMTVLFSGLRLGANSWDTVERSLGSAAEINLALGLIERQLALAMPVTFAREGESETLAFEGSPTSVTWVSPLPAHRGGGGVHHLSLDLGETDRGRGLVLTWRLFHPDVMRMAAGRAEESALLLEGITEVRFSYYGALEGTDRLEWHDRWDHPRSVPTLIRLELQSQEWGAHRRVLVVEPRQDRMFVELEFAS